ncbi:outer membrane protein [Serratia microhaemolytica]|uniref:outer membrane protein n=1 Tax=Serratia microhaemolytica TaxID=2675110 RepID=UPI000FDF0A5D|nr:outer membrane beta-barrel protein [Serratia microhaemolytica]
MNIKPLMLVISLATISGHVFGADDLQGYYGSIKLLQAEQSAKNMDLSSRPSVGSFVRGDENANFLNGAIAAGYQFANGWRSEGEYVFNKKNEYTSGSTNFSSSFNHHQIDVQRLMLNVYRDYALAHNFSIYGTLGFGVAKIESSGWQGNVTRQYGANTQNNLVYSVGAGVSYTPLPRLSFDLGYRYVDLGNVDSGYNQFSNVRGLKDEQMSARITASEVVFATRYLF